MTRRSFSPARATVGLLVALACLSLLHAATHAQSLLKVEQDRAVYAALAGTWRSNIGDATVTLTFTDDRRFQIGERSGAFSLQGATLVLTDGEQSFTYNYALSGDQLTLSGGDLADTVIFARQLEVTRYLAGWLDITPQAVWTKVSRIVFILGIVLVARLIIALLRAVSYLLVFSNLGPLQLIYRAKKNRSRTIHSLVLNIVKYFIYLTAFGMVLSELGINYTTYIASLSVVGLAIGFGSQGLVQDMVTGLFIVLESQFDVGDMVEISGQHGIVVELGLRMTKVRNYLGQTVVIPNRNIAVIGNYSRGAQRAYIEVAIPDPETGERGAKVLDTLGEQLLEQFDGVVMGPMRVTGPTSLETGEHYLRLHLSIWPGQQWVIDQQIIPRIRELFKRHEIPIPSDRVFAFYHARDIVIVPTWRSRLSNALRAKHEQEATTEEAKPEAEQIEKAG